MFLYLCLSLAKISRQRMNVVVQPESFLQQLREDIQFRHFMMMMIHDALCSLGKTPLKIII